MRSRITRTTGLARKVGLMAGPALLIAASAAADTAGNSGSGGMSPLMIVFLVFIGVIVLMQLIPALVLFGSLISAVFKRSKKATETAAANERV